MTTVPGSAHPFAQTAYAWLASLDPASFPTDGIPAARDGLLRVHETGRALLAELPDEPGTESLDRISTDLQTFLTALPAPAELGDSRVEWLDLRVAVSPLYEAVALSIKAAGGHARHLHPTNLLRSLVHLASGLMVVAAFQFVFTPTTGFLTALAFVVWAWSLEYARRASARVNRWCMVFFGPIARDHERYRINSATWYGTSLLVLSVTAYGPAGILGLLSLAIGDPMAGIIGRSYGRTRWWGGKSVEGSVAFALSATTLCYLYLLTFQFGLASSFGLLGVAAVAGCTGAVVELLSTRLEDNFTIPVLTAWAVLLVLP